MFELNAQVVGASVRDVAFASSAAAAASASASASAAATAVAAPPAWTATATGEGEAITTALLSYKVSERILQNGDTLTEAMSWGISELIEEGVSVGLISLGKDGPGEGLSNTDMPWAEWHG